MAEEIRDLIEKINQEGIRAAEERLKISRLRQSKEPMKPLLRQSLRQGK